jgi:hypothetical protein
LIQVVLDVLVKKAEVRQAVQYLSCSPCPGFPVEFGGDGESYCGFL